jgi:hypothetical protein
MVCCVHAALFHHEQIILDMIKMTCKVEKERDVVLTLSFIFSFGLPI